MKLNDPRVPAVLAFLRAAAVLIWVAALVLSAGLLAVHAGAWTKLDLAYLLIVIVAARELWDWAHL